MVRVSRMIRPWTLAGVGVGALLLTMVGCGNSWLESQDSLVEEGNQKYAAHEYPDAINAYNESEAKNGANPVLNFNRAASLHRQSQYPQAVEENLKGLTQADEKLKAGVYYNMGNSLLLQGKLEEAIDSYKRSLKLLPGNRDAIFNLELAERALEQQKEKNKNQPPQKEGEEGEKNADNSESKPDSEGEKKEEEKKGGEEDSKQAQDSQSGQEKDSQKDAQKEARKEPDSASGEDQKAAQNSKNQEGKDQGSPQEAAQAQAIPKSEADKLLDRLENNEKAFQMRRFMLQEERPARMEQEW